MSILGQEPVHPWKHPYELAEEEYGRRSVNRYQDDKERHEEARRRWPGALGGANNLKILEVPESLRTETQERLDAAPPVGSAAWRKQRPLYSGVMAYFPDALLEVAHASFVGNQQHNAGQPLHWAKEKSTDEPDAAMRHLLDRAKGEKFDTDNVRHLAKHAWRALANLQREIEEEREDAEKQRIIDGVAGKLLAYRYEPGQPPPTAADDPRVIPLKNRRDPAA